MKIIIFSPHPDDEVFGAGGSILKWLEEGHDIHRIWFTDGRAGYRKAREISNLIDCEETRISEDQLAEIRLQEAVAAADLLGIKKENRYFLKYYDQELKNHIDEAIENIKDIVKNADRFVIPSANNNHPDHQATHDIAIKVAEYLNLDKLEFFVFALYNMMRAKGEHLVKVKIGDLRFKAYEAVKLHKSQFYTKYIEGDSLWVKRKSTDRFGYYKLTDLGKFYNF